MKIMARNMLAVVGTLSLIACGDSDDDSTPRASNTIVDVAQGAGTFNTLTSALESTGLDEVLRGAGPFTVFAPTDAAFDRLPAGVLASLDSATLSEILTYHVVGARVPASEVVAADSATSVQGADVSIAVAGSTVILDGVVQVTTTDIEADNGIIHVIDAVLLPPSVSFPGDIVDAVSAYPVFDTLVGAVVTADLVDALKGSNNGDGLTLFAPTDAAFTALGVDLGTLSVAELTDILLYHVVGDTVNAATVVGLDSASTLEGGSIDIALSSGSVILDGGATVTWTDIEVSNGIVHVIDSVLLP